MEHIAFNYEKLEISQLSFTLIDAIYEVTKNFPNDERFALISQLRRAVTSILLNIAEGSGRYHKKDFSKFIRNAIGSLLETDAALRIALRRQYFLEDHYQTKLRPSIQELFYKLIAFERSLIGQRDRD